jgi:hypothetical protein
MRISARDMSDPFPLERLPEESLDDYMIRWRENFKKKNDTRKWKPVSKSNPIYEKECFNCGRVDKYTDEMGRFGKSQSDGWQAIAMPGDFSDYICPDCAEAVKNRDRGVIRSIKDKTKKVKEDWKTDPYRKQLQKYDAQEGICEQCDKPMDFRGPFVEKDGKLCHKDCSKEA